MDHKTKADIVLHVIADPRMMDILTPAPSCHHRAFVWFMRGTNDAKLIFALDEESAARIAIRARMDSCEQPEREARLAVEYDDDIRPLDVSAMLFQGEASLWDGNEGVARLVRSV